MGNPIIPYRKRLREFARELRNNPTSAEKRLWKSIRRKQIEEVEFHRQVPIDEFIVDFYCHELKLAIEVDGPYHDFQIPKDGERQEVLEGFGIEVIRFLNEEVEDELVEVISQLTLVVKSRKDLLEV